MRQLLTSVHVMENQTIPTMCTVKRRLSENIN